MLEGRACEMFAQTATEDHIDQLEMVFSDLKRAARQNDHAEILRIKIEFYRVIFDGSNCIICKELVHSLMSRIGALRQLSLTNPLRDKVMIREIGRLVAAARQRDGAAMKDGCVAHVKSALNAVIFQLSENKNSEKGV